MGDFFYAEHQEAAGIDGGATTSGSWNARTINTEIINEISAILASNQITLDAGTYEIECWANFYRSGNVQLRFQNITDALTEIWGQMMKTGTKAWVAAYVLHLYGVITITATKVFEVQYYATGALSPGGQGANFNVVHAVDHETYAQLKIRKVA
jgi:hypothetical protein